MNLCRHCQISGAYPIGDECVFIHDQAEMCNPNDPITFSRNILADPKMHSSFIVKPMDDIIIINTTIMSQQ
jgi:hypothetical protein